MITQAKKTIIEYMAIHNLDMKSLSKLIGKNKNYITHAFHDGRVHHVVLAAEHIVTFPPAVLKWAEDTMEECMARKRHAPRKKQGHDVPVYPINQLMGGV